LRKAGDDRILVNADRRALAPLDQFAIVGPNDGDADSKRLLTVGGACALGPTTIQRA
jgi:hypothetical protein